MQISFVIPAYNASKTIERTLNSIYSIDFQNSDFEVIVIDDCSLDDTVRVVVNYCRENLKLLVQSQNHRQGAARNRGIGEAVGDYIMFVDADDVVEPGVVEALESAESLNVDVLFGNYLWAKSAIEAERRWLPLADRTVMSGMDFCESYYDTLVNTCPISYLWKRAYLIKSGIRFVEDRRMEDFDFIEKNLYYSSSVGYSSAIIYKVLTFENLSSTTHSFSFETEADWVHAAYRRMKFVNQIAETSPSFSNRIIKQSKEFVKCRLSFMNLLHLPKGSVKKMFQKIGNDERHFLLQKGPWPLFSKICLKYPKLIAFMYYLEKCHSLNNKHGEV